MDDKAIFQLCKEEGCCDACSLRYLGLHHPRVYENVKESAAKYQDEPAQDTSNSNTGTEHSNGTNGVEGSGAEDEPAAKKMRGAVCVSCLGLLQPETWPDSCRMAKEMMDKKGYDCTTFACALSAPVATLLRERRMQLIIKEKFPEYDTDRTTSLKEAWKWSFGTHLATHLGLALDSGAVCPLLLTMNYEYPHDGQELEVLKSISPALFAPHKRPACDVTRRGVEQALAAATVAQLRGAAGAGAGAGAGATGAGARCVASSAARAPLYLGGRYVKLSRQLPQTPWLVRGKRMMESSVQEIIFKPIADICQMAPSEAEHRLKFVAAGREDVDVRCLGDGRPFAIEISDPRRALTAAELALACAQVAGAGGGAVRVKHMVHVNKEDLTELKKGEETKCKEYEALCIKLSHSTFDEPAGPDTPVTVTPADLARISGYTNTEPGSAAVVRLRQKTPIRVLHRRPLLTREKEIYKLEAEAVPGHPSLFVVRLRCSAGLYVKEWAHGELRRSAPALRAALAARADMLALDVTTVQLEWPPTST